MKHLVVGAVITFVLAFSVLLKTQQDELIDSHQLIASNTESEVRVVSGQVIGPDGPLGDVIVRGLPGLETKTFSNGEFFLRRAGAIVRFSLPGYRPVTRKLDDLVRVPRVHLAQDTGARWVLPPCSTSNGNETMTGELMRFELPAGVEFRPSFGIDAWADKACFNDMCITLGYGPTWGGYPLGILLNEALDVQERDIQFQGVEWNGYEYRAVRGDGTFMRMIVGAYPETVHYDHAPKEIAEAFDRIIDSVCSLQGK